MARIINLKKSGFNPRRSSNLRPTSSEKFDRATPNDKPRVISARQSQSDKTARNSSKKIGIFTRFNNSINRLKWWQFGLLTVILLALGIFLIRAYYLGGENGIISGVIGSNDPQKVQKCRDILNPDCWDDIFYPQLPQDDHLTNALLVGIDTRDNNSGLMNTDSIIVASYDHRTGKTLMVSFPRDLYVRFKINDRGPFFGKVNAVYANGQVSSKKNGMETLKTNVEEWLGIKIHYTALVNFHTLIDLVDAIGGIDIELEEKYTDVYPKKELSAGLQRECRSVFLEGEYCLFTFEAGKHHLDGEMALIYARMRQYSSDFDRARRQQEVISAVKDKFLSNDRSTVDRAKDAWGIYQTIMNKDNVDATVNYNDMLAGLFLVGKADPKPISIVLDPEFGGSGRFIYQNATPELYKIEPRDFSFAAIRGEIEKIREFPDLYRDRARVVVINRTGTKFDKESKVEELRTSGAYFGSFNIVTQEETIDFPYKIYVFNKEKTSALEYLKEYFETDLVYENPEELDIKQTNYKEDIMIIANKPMEEN